MELQKIRELRNNMENEIYDFINHKLNEFQTITSAEVNDIKIDLIAKIFINPDAYLSSPCRVRGVKVEIKI